MSTKLQRTLQTARINVLNIERDIFSAQRAFNAWAGEVNDLSGQLGINLEIPSLNIPTREQIITELYNEIGLPNSDSQTLIDWRRRRKADFDDLISRVQSVENWINTKFRKPLNAALVYIEIGLRYIKLFEILLRLLNLLLKGLKIALIPLQGFLASASIARKISEKLDKITGSINKGYEEVKTFRENIEKIIEKVDNIVNTFIQKLINTLRIVIGILNETKAFIDAISIDLLKSLLGIINIPHRNVLDNYASTIDTPDIIVPPATNGDSGDINKRIGDIVDPTNPPPRYIAELTNEQLTRLQFILNEQDKIKKDETKNYLESLTGDISLEQLNLTLAEIRRLLSLNLLVLTREDEEYLRLLEQYNLTPTPEEQPIVQVPLRPGEFERYGLNRDNAVVSYERRNT
jgi:hypothetical protein